VVGAGNAALCAAIAAGEAGARTLVLEKAPYELRGGNSRFTGGIFRFSYPTVETLKEILEAGSDFADVIVEPYTSADYRADLNRLMDGRGDWNLLDVLIDRSLDTVRWLKQRGVRWEFARSAVEARDAGSGRLSLQLGAAVRTLGKGEYLVSALFNHAEAVGVQVSYDTEVTGLLREDGRVVGVRCIREGLASDVRAAAVVLGSGGFESDAARRVRNLGPSWDRIKVRGTRFNTGEMLDAALAVGAAPSGDWQDCHATPLGADSPDYGELARGANTNRLSYTWGIQVNLDGERFADEGEDHKLFTYAKMGKLIHRQREGLAFQLYDAQAISLLEERYDTSVPFVGDSIGQVVDLIAGRYGALGFNPTRFLETVMAYNAATPSGNFDPTILDGLSTEGLEIEKTNWARPIARPPFVVYPVTTGITFTYGGIRINRDAAVLDAEGGVIPGLFATGEITGDFFYGNYPAGAGLMRGSVFGRIAGERAAAAVELPIS